MSFESFNRLYDGLNTARYLVQSQEKSENPFGGEPLKALEAKTARLLAFSHSLKEKERGVNQEAVEYRKEEKSNSRIPQKISDFIGDQVEALAEKLLEKKINQKLKPLTGLECEDLKNLSKENFEEIACKSISHVTNVRFKPLLGIELSDIEDLNEENVDQVMGKVADHLTKKFIGLSRAEVEEVEKALDIVLDRTFCNEENEPSFSFASLKKTICDAGTLYRGKRAASKSVAHLTGLSITEWEGLKTGSRFTIDNLLHEDRVLLFQKAEEKLRLAQTTIAKSAASETSQIDLEKKRR